jgi:predicted RNA-binding protein YlqC (UPF0109 family)
MKNALDLISHIAVNVVDHPDEVRIRPLDRGNEVIFEVHVHPEDQGAIIGRGGQTANALRTFLDVMGRRDNRRYTLEIADTDEVADTAAPGTAAPAVETEAGEAE